jgi:Tol biopolymer transport system component/imidazolonepropionase-like amidohydrolase
MRVPVALSASLLGLAAPVLAQDIRVTLREGTNIAAAVSPDGQTVAFDLQGRLWVLPLAGGRAIPITDELGDVRQPAWSPSGDRIAFQSYRDGNWHVWTARPDGSGIVQLTFGPFDDREPHWSPDGERIAFSSDRAGNYDIWELSLATGALARLTENPIEEYSPAYAPDGGRIALVSQSNGETGVWIRSADGSLRSVFRDAGDGGAPSFSPDGRHVAFTSIHAGQSRLLVASAGPAGGEEREPRVVSDAGEDVFPFRVSWTGPERLVYTADGRIKRRALDGSPAETIAFQAELALTRPSYERRRRDFDSTDPSPVLGIVGPAISPSGDRVAFFALGDLWLLALGGSGTPERLTDDPYVEVDPAWSPDGQRLAYVSDRGGTMDLWIRDLAAGAERHVAQPGSEAYPAWSPDGSRIAFLSVRGLSSDLQVLDLVSGEVSAVRHDLFTPGRPTWSADGSVLALSVHQRYSSRFREGTNEIQLVSLEAGAERDRIVTPFLHRSIGTRGTDGPVWSPDGKLMAFAADGALWTVEVSPSGEPIGPLRRLLDGAADALSWTRDSESLLVQTSGGLTRVRTADGQVEQIPLKLNWRRKQPGTRLVVHAGRLFDGRSPTPQRNVDVLIDGHRIAGVVPHAAEQHRGREVVDGSRGTVIPGLNEMHSHQTYAYGESLGRLWLAYGVTTVRDPASEAFSLHERREAVGSGARVGPREFAAGQIFDGTRTYYAGSLSLYPGAQLNAELEGAWRLEYDLVKTYVRLPDALQRRIVAQAHERGVPVSSHELYPAVAFGADHVEHIRGTSRRGYSPKVSALNRSYEDVIQLLGASGMTLTPTIGIMGGFLVATARDPSVLDDRRILAFLAAGHVEFLRRSAAEARGDLAERAARLAQLGATVRRVVAAGGRVVAGTDSPIIPYGLSLHTELEHYVDGGLTPVQALQTATLWAAEALGAAADLGSIEPGKLADLLVVDGDPLRDITHARRVRVVIKNGEVYRLEELMGRAVRR